MVRVRGSLDFPISERETWQDSRFVEARPRARNQRARTGSGEKLTSHEVKAPAAWCAARAFVGRGERAGFWDPANAETLMGEGGNFVLSVFCFGFGGLQKMTELKGLRKRGNVVLFWFQGGGG